MRISPSPPDVKPNEWYNTTDAVKKMGMSRSTFWRKAREGVFKRKLRIVDGNFWYQGKELLRVWSLIR